MEKEKAEELRRIEDETRAGYDKRVLASLRHLERAAWGRSGEENIPWHTGMEEGRAERRLQRARDAILKLLAEERERTTTAAGTIGQALPESDLDRLAALQQKHAVLLREHEELKQKWTTLQCEHEKLVNNEMIGR